MLYRPYRIESNNDFIRSRRGKSRKIKYILFVLLTLFTLVVISMLHPKSQIKISKSIPLPTPTSVPTPTKSESSQLIEGIVKDSLTGTKGKYAVVIVNNKT